MLVSLSYQCQSRRLNHVQGIGRVQVEDDFVRQKQNRGYLQGLKYVQGGVVPVLGVSLVVHHLHWYAGCGPGVLPFSKHFLHKWAYLHFVVSQSSPLLYRKQKPPFVLGMLMRFEELDRRD